MLQMKVIDGGRIVPTPVTIAENPTSETSKAEEVLTRLIKDKE